MGKRPKRPSRTGSVRQRGERSWELRVYDSYARKTRTKTVTAHSRREAEDKLSDFVDEVRNGRTARAPSTLTVAQLADDWLRLKGPKVGHQTQQTYAYCVRVMKRHGIASIPVRSLQLRDIESFEADLFDKMAHDTVRTVMGALRMSLKRASRAGALPPDLSLEHLDTPRHRPRHRQIPHDALIHRFLDALASDHRDLALLLAFTGIRREEVCGLQVGDVNLQHPNGPRLTITRVVQRGGGKRLESGAKTDAGNRTLALGPDAAAILRRRIQLIHDRVGDDPRLFVFSPTPFFDDFYAVDSVTQFFRLTRREAGAKDAGVRSRRARRASAA